MATAASRSSSKASRAPSQSHSPKSNLSSHLAMLELKQRILSALSKLSDRDTYQIAVEDLERIIRTLPPEGVPTLLNSLLHDPPSPEPSSRQSPLTARRECLRLLGIFCSAHPDLASPHLTKIISHIVRRIKDPSSDTSVRDSCRDAAGSLSSLYLRQSAPENNGSLVSAFVKPFLEAMAEQNKLVQAGASSCLARIVESAGIPENPQETAPSAAAFQKLAPRVTKFLSSQSFQAKAALLSVVSSLSQIGAITPQNLPPLLQSVIECLESSDWSTRKAAGETLSVLASHSSHLIADNTASTVAALESCRFDKVKPVRDSVAEALTLWKKLSGNGEEGEEFKDNRTSEGSNPQSGIPEKAAVLLKKKVPSLTDKELNAEFFQKLETRVSDDLPVEVVVPRKGFQSSLSQSDVADDASRGNGHNQSLRDVIKEEDLCPKMEDNEDSGRVRASEPRSLKFRDGSISRVDGQNEGFMNSKGNWIAIQRQLSLLERQQASLMNMLQEFMGGSHDSMLTLENRVRGLERIVDEMARDLSLSSNRRVNSTATGRPTSKYNGRFAFTDRFLPPVDTFDSYPYPTSRRAWEKGPGSGPFRLGEGPSARSVWQASKDEATLEAIRGAGPDSAGYEGGPDKGELWAAWSRAVDSAHVGDVDSAYAEVLMIGDDLLLVKMMDRTGPVMDQLSEETVVEVLRALGRFVREQGLLDIALAWINQLTEMVSEEGGTLLPSLKGEIKREILLGLHAASSSMEPPEEWDGPAPEQMLRRLASAWGVSLQQLLN